MRQLYFAEIESRQRGDALDEMFLSLPDERKARLLRYRHEADRIIGTCADVLVRCLICRNAGIEYGDIEIAAAPSGKPYLTSRAGFEFNTSHTKYAVAAAFSEEPVGVDIEGIRLFNTAVSKRIFSCNELRALEGSDEDRILRFFETWTKKEALLKCRGTGLVGDMSAIDTTVTLPGEEITTVHSGRYIISVCSKVKFDESSFIKISEADLFDLWRDCAR
jgi:4'-phosphopantetheinyl transferase